LSKSRGIKVVSKYPNLWRDKSIFALINFPYKNVPVLCEGLFVSSHCAEIALTLRRCCKKVIKTHSQNFSDYHQYQVFSKVFPIFSQNFPKTFSRFLQEYLNKSFKISPRFSQGFSKDFSKIFPRFSKHFSKILPRFF
jgi:hypothetical protein